jgi:CysZ protein
MFNQIITSIRAYFKTHRFIVKHRLWKWILIPGLIYSLFFCAGIYLFWKLGNVAIDFILLKTGVKLWIQKMQDGWLSWFILFVRIMLQLVLMLFYFSLFKYLFLIVGSPFFAYLSEKTEAIMEGSNFPFSIVQLIKDVVRGMRIALRNILWQTVYTVSIFIIAFIPLIGWVTPLIALMVECYYLGFSMLDYSSERHKLTTSQSIAFISKRKGLAIGNGLIFYLMHLIPIVGWVLAPGYAVIAATISLYGNKDSDT